MSLASARMRAGSSASGPVAAVGGAAAAAATGAWGMRGMSGSLRGPPRGTAQRSPTRTEQVGTHHEWSEPKPADDSRHTPQAGVVREGLPPRVTAVVELRAAAPALSHRAVDIARRDLNGREVVDPGSASVAAHRVRHTLADLNPARSVKAPHVAAHRSTSADGPMNTSTNAWNARVPSSANGGTAT